MSEPTIELSKDGADYARMAVQMVTPVSVTSSQSMGQSGIEAGIGLQFTVNSKAQYVPVLTALEIARETVDAATLEARVDAVMRSTVVGMNEKKNIARYLDPESPHYQSALKRVTMMAQVAATNFVRDIGTLVRIHDEFTNPTNGRLPEVSSFQLQTAFTNHGLLSAYRTKHGIAENQNPMLTDKAREVLVRHKIACKHIPSYSAATLAAKPLPAAPAALRAAFQMESFARELQVIEHALQMATQNGVIPPIKVNQQFREQLVAAIADARQAQGAAAAAVAAITDARN